MERKYIIAAILLVILALGLAVLPKQNELKETDPKLLLSSIVERSRYLTVDQVTHRIIENDPTLMLVDLRSADQFRMFALPGSINIPCDYLLSPSNLEFFNQPGKEFIVYANSDLTAEKAWLLCSRNAINRICIMKGGMNEWYNTIIAGNEVVSGTPSSSDLDLASFRKAARQFFIGSGDYGKSEVTSAVHEKVQLIRKAPKATSGGGC